MASIPSRPAGSDHFNWVYLGLLNQPILYHSRYINQNKPICCDLLQRVRISQDLINTLFKHPYTKINFFAGEMGISAVTARNQLEQLVSIGILSKVRIGRPNYYVNDALVRLFAAVD